MFKLKISTALNAFGVLLVAGVLIVSAVALATSLHIRIGGQRFNDIIQSKDLVADVLPPPVFIVEAYLETTLIRDGRVTPVEGRQRLSQLRKDYQTRHDFWQASSLPDDIKRNLTEVSDRHVQAFFDIVDGQMLPAIERGDRAAVDAAYERAEAAYKAHRGVISTIVAQADAYGKGVVMTSDKDARTAAAVAATLVAALLAVVIGGIVALSRGVVAPLSGITDRMKRLAEGDNQIDIPSLSRQDEVGEMAKAVMAFKQSAQERIRIERQAADQQAANLADRERNDRLRAEEAEEQSIVVTALASGLQKLSEGDLAFRITTPFAPAYEKLRADFNGAQGQLQATMSTIVGNAGSLQTSAAEISQAADDLSRRTEQQAASLEETAAALDEITITVRATAGNAGQARQAVEAARTEAEAGGLIVTDAVAAMGQIEKSSGEIGQIIGVIDEIAFQTNLLALNAGVEAARAGDAGRGFAVVASEVRALAQRSAEAAKEIKALISASANQVNSGVDLVGQTGKALRRIVGQIGDITEAVTKIATSAQEEATGIQQVNIAVNQMDQVTQQNAAMVEQTTAASHSLAREASDLRQLVGKFRIGDAAGSTDRAAYRSRAA